MFFNLRTARNVFLLLCFVLHSAHGVGRNNRRLKGAWSVSQDDAPVDLEPTNTTTAMTDDTIMDEGGANSTDIYRGARKGASKKMKSKKGGSDSSDDDAKSAKSGKGSSNGGKGSNSGKGAFSKKSRSSKKRGSKIQVSTNNTYSSDDMKSIDTGFFDDDFEWPVGNSTKGGSHKGSSSRSH